MARRPLIVSTAPAKKQPDAIVEEAPQVDASQAEVSVLRDGTVQITVGTPANDTEPGPDKGGFDANLAEHIPEGILDTVAEYLLERIQADDDARRPWLDTANLGARYLGTILEEPTPNAADGTICKTVASCMLKALLKLWGAAVGELLPAEGPIKVKRDDTASNIDGPREVTMPDGTKVKYDELADALQADLNWYLTEGDSEYCADFTAMLMHRYRIGNAFRKIYKDPIEQKPLSRWVRAQNLIISNDSTTIYGASRVTEIIRHQQSVMRRMQAAGDYLSVELSMPTGEVTSTEQAVAESEGVAAAPQWPDDMEHLVYECNCRLDSYMIAGLETLDKDEASRKPKYPMPYRVSIDKDSRKVLEIRRGWEEGDKQHRRERRYVKYGFIPGDGIYDWGLLHLVGNPTLAATMIQRAVVDSSLFSNFPGGMKLASPSRQNKTIIRPTVGEFVDIDGGGTDDIRKVMLPNPYKPPSQEMLELEQHFEKTVEDIAGIVSLPVGEGRIGNTPVGTIMSYIEAVSQVPSAVHKADHRTQAIEYQTLRRLISHDPEILWRGNATPKRKWRVAEELMLPDLIPATDPNTPSSVHRLMKIQALVTLGGLPQFNMPQPIADNRAIYMAAIRILGAGDAAEFVIPEQQPQAAPPPPPDPRIVAAQIKAQSQQQSDAAKLQQESLRSQDRQQELQAEGQQRDADRQSDETRAAMSLEAARLHEGHENARQDQQHGHEAGLAAADAAKETTNTALTAGLSGGLAGNGAAQP